MAFVGYRTVLSGNDEDGWYGRPESGWLSNDTTQPISWQHFEIASGTLTFKAKTRKKALKKSERYLKRISKPKKEEAPRHVETVMFRSPW